MRRFQLNRIQDVTGISGTGVIANGVEHVPGGVCTLFWLKHETTGQYPSIEKLQAIHCYNNNASIQWIDPDHTIASLPEGQPAIRAVDPSLSSTIVRT